MYVRFVILENAGWKRLWRKQDLGIRWKLFLRPMNWIRIHPKVSDQSMQEVLAKKYGMSVEEAKNMTNNVVEQAKTVGLNYNYDEMKPANTFDAHRLAKLAEQENVGEEVTESLLHSYFIDGETIGTEDVLRIAKEAGISLSVRKQVLDSDEFAADVRMDIAEARKLAYKGFRFSLLTVNMQFQAHNQLKHSQMHFEKLRKKKLNQEK